MFTLMKSIRGEIKSYIRRCDNCKQLESAGCCRCISAHLLKKMTTSSLQIQSSHHGLQSRLCTRISYNLTVHTDKYRRAFLFYFFLVWLSVLVWFFFFLEASGSRWLRGGRRRHWQPHSSTIMSS